MNFTIFYHISQGLNPTQIAKKYKWSKTKVSYYIKELKANGYIQKIGYGTWKTTKKQVQNYHKDTSNNLNFLRKVRGHGFQFKVVVNPNLRNWNRRIEYLTKKNIPYSLVGNKASIIRIIVKGYKVWLCNKHLIIYYPTDMSFFSSSAKESRIDAVYNLHNILRLIESILGANFKIRGKYLFTIPKRHYSLINNELAGDYLKHNKKLEIRDYKGDLWALIDNSLNLKEFELVSSKTSETDTDIVTQPFFNLLRDNPKILEDLSENILLNTRMLKNMQEEIILLTKLNRR